MAVRGLWMKAMLGAIALMGGVLSSMAWGPWVFGEAAYRRFEDAGGVMWGAVICTGLILVAVFWPELTWLFGGAARERRILATGRPARAVVINLDENSGGGVVTVNEQPYLNLVLEVRDGGRPPYRVSMDLVIPRTAVPQFQPGAVVAVKVDVNDPSRVVLDW